MSEPPPHRPAACQPPCQTARLRACYHATRRRSDLDARVLFVPKRGSVKDTLMATISDLKADMASLSALIRDGMAAALPPSSRPASHICRFPPID